MTPLPTMVEEGRSLISRSENDYNSGTLKPINLICAFDKSLNIALETLTSEYPDEEISARQQDVPLCTESALPPRWDSKFEELSRFGYARDSLGRSALPGRAG